MTTTSPATGLQLRSLVKKEGTLELSLATVPVPEPKPEEVVVRVDASPINPSDQGLLFGGADLSTAKASGTAASPVVTATIPPAALKGLAGRRRSADARRQRGGRRGRRRRDVASRPGPARQDGRHRGRRHVHPVSGASRP